MRSRLAISTIFAATMLMVMGCGSEPQTLKEPQSFAEPGDADTTGKLSPVALTAYQVTRFAQGDTTMGDAQVLSKSMTESISGYKLEISTADTLKMAKATLLEAKKVFYNPEGDFIELVVTDYGSDTAFIAMSLVRFNLADNLLVQGIREDRQSVQGFPPSEAKHAFSWVAFDEKRKTSTAHCVLNGRYYVSANATNQSKILDLKTVAGWFDFKPLLSKPGQL